MKMYAESGTGRVRRSIPTGVLGLALLATACGGETEATEAPSTATAEVVRTDMRISAEATGLIEPIRTVEVKSKASGEILRLHVDTGDRVSQGQLLAEVDPRDVRNAFEQAEADLEVARARVDISTAQLTRSEELQEAGVITQQEFESANLEQANARAQLVKAETNLELAELRLSDVTIRAPMDGTIISRSAEVGQVIQSASGNVSGGTTLFLMANLDDVQVRTLVDETDVGQLAAGLEATVRVEAFPDRSFSGDVEKIEPQAEVVQNVTMFPVIVYLDNRAGLLKPGMNAEVEVLVDERRDVLTVPNNAVVEPRQFAPAAMALGLDPENLDFDLRASFAGRRGGAGGPGGAAARPAGGPAGGEAAQSADGASQPERQTTGGPSQAMRGEGITEDQRARFAAIRQQVQDGEITQDSARALFRAMGGRGGARAGTRGAGVDGEGAEAPGMGRRDGRAGVVFTMSETGELQPKSVMLGLSDWDQTEVISGLEGGEIVAIIGAAQLQAQQQEFINRIRSRSSPFGGGGRR